MRLFPVEALLVIGIVALAAAPSRAEGQGRPQIRAGAQLHLDRGLELYQGKHFDTAASEFQAAYAIDPHRDVLYVWAQALRLGGRCVDAVPLYEKFLAAAPPANEADLARKNVERCRADAAAAVSALPITPDATAPATQPASAAIQQTNTTDRPTLVQPIPPAVPPAVRRDLTGRLLIGATALALVTSGGFALAAGSERSGVSDAQSYSELEQRGESIRFREHVAWAALAVGGALLVATAIHYVVRSNP